jgi:7-keto-8-aminopelargonate synthetase-like enzyme
VRAAPTYGIKEGSSVKSAWNERLELVQGAVDLATRAGLAHQTLRDRRLDGRHIELRTGHAVHFGSCSYLGLETDQRLKQAAADAVERFGVVFSSSRVYLSVPLYDEYEALLSRMVGGCPVVLAPNTSLAHQAALPVLVGDHDAVCYDILAHTSVHAALPALLQRGVHCEPLPHNRLDVLERRARRLAQTHHRVFFLCDGVYSMHGDIVELGALFDVMERVPSLFAYVDDAHGVGWAGRHGAGVVLGEHGPRERVIVALGLAKSFATGGAFVAVPDPELAHRIRSCGGPLLFSGPLQPAQLGAGIASAKIHLSPELPALQQRLRVRIELFDALAAALGIECVATGRSPIRFIELGSNERATAVGKRLLDAGFFVNVSTFPAVARGHSGIRLMLNANQTLDDVRRLVHELAQCLEDNDADLPPTRRTGVARAAERDV